MAILLALLMGTVSLAGCLGTDNGDSSDEMKIVDSDGDGVLDSVDNCPDLFNPDQDIGFEGYECSSDERYTSNAGVATRSGGGSGVTSMVITQDAMLYDLNDVVGADFTGTWFEPHSGLLISAHLRDANGNIHYNNLINFNGYSSSLDTLHTTDPALGGHTWPETGPSHPTNPWHTTNNYDFSASTLGVGVFCWWASIEARLGSIVNGQYTTINLESDIATECFEIVQDLDATQVQSPNDNVTLCDSNSTMYTDIYSTNLSNMDAEGRFHADYNSFHSATWSPLIAPPFPNNPSSWGNPPPPSDWAWLDLAAAGWTAHPYDFVYQNIDLKISFDIPAGATDVTAEFNGKVDNLFIPVKHPELGFTASYDPKSAVIQNSVTQSLTAWQMPEIQMADSDWFAIGQTHVGWLPDNVGNLPESYDLLISARNRNIEMGVAITLEVSYCIENITTDDGTGNDDNLTGDDDHNQTHDNHPPHIDAEVYFTNPAMLNYDFGNGTTADEYNYSAFISWDTWDIDGIVETVEVDYDRDGVADIMLPEVESPYFHLIYPYHLGIELETVVDNGQCYILPFRMIDLIATDDDGDSVTYTIRTGTDEVNDWYYPNNDPPLIMRRDAKWFTDTYLIQDPQYEDWIYGVGNNECPSPIQLQFTENTDSLTDSGMIGTLNIISMGDDSFPTPVMVTGTIVATDSLGNPVTNRCSVQFIFVSSGGSNQLSVGDYWEIHEADVGDGMICGIDPADAQSYSWTLDIGGYAFNLPNMIYPIS